MAIPAVNDIYLITFQGRLSNQVIMSTFWYKMTQLGPEATVLDVYQTLRTQTTAGGALQAKLLNALPVSYGLEQVWFQKIYPTRIMKGVYIDNSVGAFAAPADTANLAAVIERRAEKADRRSVSTLHVPLPNANTIGSEGIITDALYKNALDALALQMVQEIVGAGAVPSKFRPIVFNPRALQILTDREIVQCTTQTTIRVMRRRTVGLGI